MGRRLLSLMLAGPPALAGSFAAHQLGYALADDGATGRERLLAQAEHGYVEHVPTVLVALLSVLALAALLTVMWEARGGASAAPSAWLVLLVVPAVLVSQELLERLATDQPPLEVLISPPVLWGLVLQLPFAFVAWLLALVVSGSARAVGRRLRRRSRAPVARAQVALRVRRQSARQRSLPALASCAAGRAPPLLLALS